MTYTNGGLVYNQAAPNLLTSHDRILQFCEGMTTHDLKPDQMFRDVPFHQGSFCGMSLSWQIWGFPVCSRAGTGTIKCPLQHKSWLAPRKFSIQRLGLGDAHLPFDWTKRAGGRIAVACRVGNPMRDSAGDAFQLSKLGVILK